MAEANFDIEGINYFTLFELPDSQDRTAPCVLLVHALMSNLNMYDSTVKALHSAGYSTLRYDHVGHHNTPPPADRKLGQRRMSLDGSLVYHMDDLTRHMHALVKQATGQTSVHAVIGCSIGGVLALRYAMMFPKEVEQVISIAAPGIKAMEDKKPLWSKRIQLFEDDVSKGEEKLCLETVNRWVPGSSVEDEAVRKEALTHVRTCSIQGYRLLADSIRNYDYSGELGKIGNVKCLIGGGTEDGAIDLAALKEVSEQIEGATFVEMHGAGHLPPMHIVDEFNRVMLDFLGKPEVF